MSATARFGVTGLAVMGANLARNVAHHGIPIAVHNRTAARTETFMAEHGTEGDHRHGVGRRLRRRRRTAPLRHGDGQGGAPSMP